MSFAMQFDFLISEPNCERVSRICDVDIYIYTLVYIYIYAFRFYVILYVFLCALCGVRNNCFWFPFPSSPNSQHHLDSQQSPMFQPVGVPLVRMFSVPVYFIFSFAFAS